MPKSSQPAAETPKRTSLKMLAELLGLSPSTISFVLNDTPDRSIPESTRQRIKEAARQMNYQPSMIARTLRGKRTQAVGVLLPELGGGYHDQILTSIGDLLMREGFLYFTVLHRHSKELVCAYQELLRSRGVDGFLAVDTHLEGLTHPLPTISIAGHTHLEGVTNVVLNHRRAAELAVGHLYEQGHRHIAFMRGPAISADTETRWNANMRAARQYGIEVSDALSLRLEVNSHSPEISYPLVHQLIKSGVQFSAILCFNDVSAMGSIRALHEAGLRVPEDVSVLGFDDIQPAAYHVPSLTTIRQPLHEMGSSAARLLLTKLSGQRIPETLRVDPELIIRESTAPAPNSVRRIIR